jgi:hypothetical protein
MLLWVIQNYDEVLEFMMVLLFRTSHDGYFEVTLPSLFTGYCPVSGVEVCKGVQEDLLTWALNLVSRAMATQDTIYASVPFCFLSVYVTTTPLSMRFHHALCLDCIGACIPVKVL